jgi:hypothetical protein
MFIQAGPKQDRGSIALAKEVQSLLFTLWSPRWACNLGRDNRSPCRSEQGLEGVVVEAPVEVTDINLCGSGSCGHGRGTSRGRPVLVERVRRGTGPMTE